MNQHTALIVIYAVALILAAVDEARAQGQSLTDWAVILIAGALLWLELT